MIPYIEEQHKSEFEAKEEDGYIDSTKISPPAESEELESWAG